MSQPNPRSESISQNEEGVSEPRTFAVLAYIVPVIGGILGLALDSGNPLTRNHAQQSIAAVLTLVLSFLIWAVTGYLIGQIPIFGPIFALSLFSLVIAMAAFLSVNWIYGLIVAMRGQERTIPLANKIVSRLFGDAGKTSSAKVSA